MFTGIVEEVGTVFNVKGRGDGGRELKIACKTVIDGIKIGDSLAVNGVCLTIVEKGVSEIGVEAVEETIKKTTLGLLRAGDKINLERSVTLESRLGGHLVQGHVDVKGKVVSIEKLRMSRMYRIRMPRDLMRYLVPVGSVAVDGVSLTVAEKFADSFKVAIIPHTLDNTIFKFLRVGSTVNIEIDMIAKMVASVVEPYVKSSLTSGHGKKNSI